MTNPATGDREPNPEFVLVPREPTEAMLATQGKSRPDLAKSDATRRVAERLNDEMRRMAGEIWHEMLAAAPRPSNTIGGELVRDLMLLMESYTAYAGDAIPASLVMRSQDLHARLSALQAPQYTGGVEEAAAIRLAAIEDVLGLLTGHELYRYRPKAFNGFIEYARTELAAAR